MTSLFDKLNLTPQERRLVVFVGLFLFVVVNLWLVWPHFGDLGLWQQRKRDMTNKLRQYEIEIQKKSVYERERLKLQNAGQVVSDESKARELLLQVQRQAAASRVRIVNATPRSGSSTTVSNAFFDEETVLVTFESGQSELIDFLYSLGSKGSLIRVRSMTLGPDPATRTKLAGSITLVESFRRASATPATPSPTPTPTAAAARPGAATPPTEPANNAPPAPMPSAAASINPGVSPRKTKTSQPEVTPMRIQPTNSGVIIPKRRVLTPPSSPNNS